MCHLNFSVTCQSCFNHDYRSWTCATCYLYPRRWGNSWRETLELHISWLRCGWCYFVCCLIAERKRKFETGVSDFRPLYSCCVFPWIHVTSFMVSRITVCSRALGGLGSCLFLSTLLKIVTHHYLGTGINMSALGESWQNPTDRLTAFKKYFSVAK